MPQLFLAPADTGKRAVSWCLLIFALSQLALWACLECRFPELHDPLYGIRLQSLQARLAESPRAPLVLLLGSSRVKYGLWPTAMHVRGRDGEPPPLIYNFGVNGAGSIRELMYFRRLLADGIRPDWLLIETWPPLWAESGFFAESKMLVGEDELHWRDIPLVCRYFRRQPTILLRGLQKSLAPIFSYRGRLMEAAVRPLLANVQLDELRRNRRDWLPADESGWFPLTWGAATEEERRRAVARGAEQVKPLLDPLRIDPRSDTALRELLQDCQARGVHAVLVLMPEHSQTRAWYSPKARTLMSDYLDRVGREYNLPLVDTREWVGDEDFVDYCHIKERGARPFSERFGREVIQALLEGRFR